MKGRAHHTRALALYNRFPRGDLNIVNRRDFLATAGAATLSAISTPSPAQENTEGVSPTKKRPNVLLIMADQHKRSCMGVCGDAVAKTPNLDQLAQQSVRFTNAYCNNPVCAPSRASMMTGLYSHNLNDYMERPYGPRFATMPTRFGDAGYFTALIGKMHAVDAQLHGFQYQLEFNDWFQAIGPAAKLYADELGAPNSGAGQPQIRGLWRRGDPWKGHRTPDHRLGSVAVGRPSIMPEEEHFEEFVSSETVRFLETYAEQDKPFFLISSFLKPHDPFMPAQPFAGMFTPEEMSLSPTWGKAHLDAMPRRVRDYIVRCPHTPELLQAPEAKKRIAYYYGNLAQTDHCAGEVLGALSRLGLEENTIVIYTSDHGEMLSDLGLWNKFQFYEGSCGVPLMFKLPGASPAVCNAPVSLVSLSSTLTDLCGIPDQGSHDGKSFADLVRDPASTRNPGPVFAEFSLGNSAAKYMIRDGDWKYTYWVDDMPELYDLSSDPQELNNLALLPSYAAKVKDLKQKLFEWHTPPVWQGVPTKA